uniref:Glycosyltransferase 2-like domain-containing protein n=1 Tax=Nelumbo nucifera TaxID=4432 RepID=A0A822XVS9_NELNU|nr:TPA_asm: hypothetical protein HUJ06_025555 [Nelumbo nucifera]
MSPPPNYEFQEWWNKEKERNHGLFLDKSENPNWSAVEIGSPTGDADSTAVEKERSRNARQLSWVCLLKFQQAANCLAWLTNGFLYVLRTANRRVISSSSLSNSNSDSPSRSESRLYRVIKIFLVLVILLLLFELVAYFKGWHFSPPSIASAEVLGLVELVYANWLFVRANYLAPPLQLLTNVCIVLFLIQSLDRVILMLGCFWIKFRRIKPVAAMEYSGDTENGIAEDYPMALIQIPMCNEREGNDDLALVQTRWTFVNKDENLLTRLQNINLSFHFEVEQQVNGVFINFFGFNGTAGVWRIKALEESGGWMERTTVEDMDIAVRAHLNGWKFIYLNDVKCLCELPESYEAYKKQQHRWHSGPMQLFRMCFFDILRSKVSWAKKANLIFLFFLLRKLILPLYSFTLFCIILPLTMFLPEAELPAWVVCYVPGIMSVLNILPAPRSFPFIVPYLLFENTMSVTKFHAMISGLFRLGSSYEWIVTKKLGRSSEADLVAFVEKESNEVERAGLLRASSESDLAELNKLEKTKKTTNKRRNRLYRKELALAFILLSASLRSLLSAQGIHFYFLLFQGITFLVVGLDLIGEQVS